MGFKAGPGVSIVFFFFMFGCSPQGVPDLGKQRIEEPEPQGKFSFKPKPVVSKVISATEVEFPQFRDIAKDIGINHIFDNGASSQALMVESTGGGCGWLDYDGDGCLDLYLTQGGVPCRTENVPLKTDVLYRQRSGRFQEVSNQCGINDPEFGHGVACGDFDNDGFSDLFVANVGQSRFYRNLGDGTFAEETWRLQGLRDVWSSTPAWGDIDRDGDLDLYVCNYAIYDPCHPVVCLDKSGLPSICHPRNVEPEPDAFFLNSGDGHLVESAQRLGLYGPGNKALGVVIADLNADQWPDIYVANDTTANFLFINDGTGQSFRESALLLGGGVSATGEPQASMGVGFGDFDNNLLPDIVLTHFTGEHYTLYKNHGGQGFQDVTSLTGLREPTLPKLGFGIVMNDFNGDDFMDIYVTNGHIDPRYEEGEGYAMNPQLFSFNGVVWNECPPGSQEFLQKKAVGRSVASGDFDRDGDLDLCVVHHNTPVSILQNESSTLRLLQIRLIGKTSARDAINTLVKIQCEGFVAQQELPGGTSFAASHERVLSFGLGNRKAKVDVNVIWPSGKSEQFVIPEDIRSVVIIEDQSVVSRF